MQNIILFDDDSWADLLPLSFTKPIAKLRVGILTIDEKWSRYLDGKVSYVTQDYLAEKFPINIESDNLIINGTVLPTKKLVVLINQLENNEALLHKDELIAARMDRSQFDRLINNQAINELNGIQIGSNDGLSQILRPWDLFLHNEEQIKLDFELLTKGKTSAKIDSSNTIIGNNVFIEQGAKVLASTLNSTTGPIYIGKDAEVMENSSIRGPFALCESGVVKMASKIYGATTIGPHCKVGGEINNSIFTAYSNKAHDGFVGNSVIGEWCNLGADTNTSNLKNNYSEVKVWDYTAERFISTGQQFCGLIMGDHSKSGINCMFNTGTSVGVAANLFGSDYPRNFIPSFTWGGKSSYSTFKLEKVFEMAELMMKRRDVPFEDVDKKILNHIFLNSSKYRNWEN